VDLDDCLDGPVIQDLWMLCSGTPAQRQREWSELLAGYEQFAAFDLSELALVESLRAVRMLNHAAWIAARWNDPAFPRAFPWFGEPRYWERHIDELREQIEAVQDPPPLRL
jgi:Ser/Thr protein kinase RdoA (MazF antagonist)